MSRSPLPPAGEGPGERARHTNPLSGGLGASRPPGGYSAHADQADLLRFVSGMRCTPREVRVVHGDADAKAELAARLRTHGVEKVVIPGAPA